MHGQKNIKINFTVVKRQHSLLRAGSFATGSEKGLVVVKLIKC